MQKDTSAPARERIYSVKQEHHSRVTYNAVILALGNSSSATDLGLRDSRGSYCTQGAYQNITLNIKV